MSCFARGQRHIQFGPVGCRAASLYIRRPLPIPVMLDHAEIPGAALSFCCIYIRVHAVDEKGKATAIRSAFAMETELGLQ